MTTHEITDFIITKIRRLGKVTKIPFNRREREETSRIANEDSFEYRLEEREMTKWKYVKECEDLKGLWDSINIKGEFKQTTENNLDVEELAEVCNKRSHIDISQRI